MKNLFICLSVLLNFILLGVVSYNWYTSKNKLEYFNFISSRFHEQNIVADSSTVVCLVGNSITANWSNLRKEFFDETGFVTRGIGGNTSSQILLRFQQDVVSMNPHIVVLNAGINDIANGDGFYNQNFTLHNIQSIIDICKSRNISLVLTSVLPATEIKINRVTTLRDIKSTIENLNKEIFKLALENSLQYVDYNSNLRNSDGTFNINYNFDGVHPNQKGYEIMEKLLMITINDLKETYN